MKELEKWEALFSVIHQKHWDFSLEDFADVKIIKNKCKCGGHVVCSFFEGVACESYYSLHVCLNLECKKIVIKKQKFLVGDVENCLICNRSVVDEMKKIA